MPHYAKVVACRSIAVPQQRSCTWIAKDLASIRRAEQFHRLLHIQFSVPQLNRGIAKSSEGAPVFLSIEIHTCFLQGVPSSSGVYTASRISTRGPGTGIRGFHSPALLLHGKDRVRGTFPVVMLWVTLALAAGPSVGEKIQ